MPNTTVENDELNSYTELTAKGKFNQGKDGENMFVDLIISGFGGEGLASAEDAAKTVTETWFGDMYLELKQDAWNRLQDYYATLQ